ncbi:hypothetical protein VOLCADRAFT_87650 [Volvox carteri f. nagariensis]|uniref:Uncharacterized protein n=1 Tax=Volvox carteri f. nagariensis TaxID=3068 RepID=D8TLW1_VOLCA|nr:uncharacterized protein VOLCADRAFT_87650 [Volvox carteri f. nagariensis]EFJ51401.1 hypothetical protein VOLCADRAFT_87650 [Volvox carteri f. nagariensis]|eukprot:XP_002947353.1 hypothetical protein VOLCADRAFT_87650 [Volvox carteri f. nagariensis]
MAARVAAASVSRGVRNFEDDVTAVAAVVTVAGGGGQGAPNRPSPNKPSFTGAVHIPGGIQCRVAADGNCGSGGGFMCSFLSPVKNLISVGIEPGAIADIVAAGASRATTQRSGISVFVAAGRGVIARAAAGGPAAAATGVVRVFLLFAAGVDEAVEPCARSSEAAKQTPEDA